jgi:hypothetical protein
MGHFAEGRLMSTGFILESNGRIILRLDEVERMMLLSLCDQIVTLVTPQDRDPDADPLFALVGIEPSLERPEDDVMLRLFPDAYSDDEHAASDFRRFTERDLRQTKTTHAQTVQETLQRSGEKVVLGLAVAPSWLGFLNDVRLALGARMGIDDDFHDAAVELAEDDPLLAMLDVYDWLTYLQESLVQIMLA